MKNILQSRCSYKRWLPFISFFFIGFCTLEAQSITWAIVNAAGFEDGPDASLRWTIGEPLALEINGVQGTMRVGFMPFAYYEELVSTPSIDPDIEISISPNPASDEIYVRLPHDDRYTIYILSMGGPPQITSGISTSATIDIRSLPAGSYVLYVRNSAGAYNSKPFIKS